jgi:hypothetical protein
MSNSTLLRWLLLAAVLPLSVLLFWRATYQDSSLSALLLFSCFLVCTIGNFRKRYIIKRAVLNRALIKSSALDRVSRGAITSLVSALVVSLISTLSVAYIVLTAELWFIAYILVVACIFSATTWMVAVALKDQMRPPFREAIATNISLILVGTLFSVIYSAWIYSSPPPEWCNSPSLNAAGSAAFESLPRGRFQVLNEVFSYFRAIEFLSWCAKLPSDVAGRVQAITIGLQALLAFFGLVSLIGSWQTAGIDARAAFSGAKGAEH